MTSSSSVGGEGHCSINGDGNGSGSASTVPPTVTDANASASTDLPSAPMAPTSSNPSPSPPHPPPDSRQAASAPQSLRVQPKILDPYERQIEFDLPWPGRIALAIIDIALVPLRIIFIILLLVLLSLCCRVLLIGSKPALKAGDPGFGPVRTFLIRTIVRAFAAPICWSFGLVTSRKKCARAVTDRGILVANHLGYVEILCLVRYYTPSVVAKASIASYPLFGTIARALQCIFLDRADPKDRQRVMEMIVERGENVKRMIDTEAQAQMEGSTMTSESDHHFPPLLVFPEGTTSNGASLLRFQKGVFVAGAPVQPVCVRSHFCYYNAGWPNGSMLNHAMGLLARLYHPMSMLELPLYQPSAAEQSDSALYADNVCQTMGNALLQPVSTKTFRDNPELIANRTVRQREPVTSSNAIARGTVTAAALAPSASAAAPPVPLPASSSNGSDHDGELNPMTPSLVTPANDTVTAALKTRPSSATTTVTATAVTMNAPSASSDGEGNGTSSARRHQQQQQRQQASQRKYSINLRHDAQHEHSTDEQQQQQQQHHHHHHHHPHHPSHQQLSDLPSSARRQAWHQDHQQQQQQQSAMQSQSHPDSTLVSSGPHDTNQRSDTHQLDDFNAQSLVSVPRA